MHKVEEFKNRNFDIRQRKFKNNTDVYLQNFLRYYAKFLLLNHKQFDSPMTKQISVVYADEADVLNMALFGKTAKEWRNENSDKKGNIRDYASMNELICLSNLENINAMLINEGVPQSERLTKLNQIAIHQMSVLQRDEGHKYLK